MLLLQLRKGIKCNGESNIYGTNVQIILCADSPWLTLSCFHVKNMDDAIMKGLFTESK